MAQSAISYFEGDNDRAPNFKTLLRIADALEVDLGELIQRAIKDIRGKGGNTFLTAIQYIPH